MSHSNTESNSTCIMTYSHDGFGLGHLRRNTTIASHLANELPTSSILMLIGCPTGAVFKLPPGVDFMKLPSVIKRDTGVWHPLRLRIGLEREFAPTTHYCGYVCTKEPYKSKEQMRKELQVEHPLIVVTGGGGVDAYPMMQTCMQALRLLGPHAAVETIFISGPLMDNEQRERLREEAKGLKVRVLTHVEDCLSYLNAADLVVTMAGYNSLCQVLQLRKKSLVVPRSGPSAEQQMRARLFAERGLAEVIFPGDLSPKKMAGKLMEDLQWKGGPSYDPTIKTNGGRVAAARLAELLASRAYYPVQSQIDRRICLYR